MLKKPALLIFFILMFQLFSGCRIFRPAPIKEQQAPGNQGIVRLKTGKKHILFSAVWNKGDDQLRTFCVLTPPHGVIETTIEDFSLFINENGMHSLVKSEKFGDDLISDIKSQIMQNISIEEKGYCRYNFIQSIAIKARLVLKNIPHEKNGADIIKAGSCSLAEIRLRVKISEGKNSFQKTGKLRGPGLQHIFNSFTLNPDSAGALGVSTPETFLEMEEIKSILPPEKEKNKTPPLILYTEKPGLYKIDYQLIKDSGIDPEKVNPNHFHLYCQGIELPLFPWGCRAGSFLPQDALIFYGLEAKNPYSGKNAYQLYYNPSEAPMQMEIIEGEPDVEKTPRHFQTTSILEEDNELIIQSGNFLSIKGMRWVWREITREKPAMIKFDLPGYVRLPGEADVLLKLYCHPGPFKPGSRVEVKINEMEAELFKLQGNQDDEKTFKVACANLKERGNELIINFLPPINMKDKILPHSGLYFDKIEITHGRLFQFHKSLLQFKIPAGSSPGEKSFIIQRAPSQPILGVEHSDPKRPRFVRTKKIDRTSIGFKTRQENDESYLFTAVELAPQPSAFRPMKFENLSAQKNEADYLIITHPDFMKAAKLLAAHREKNGLKTRIVDVEAIYDEYNHGILSPVSIKRFLTTALLKWNRPPVYVLLIGDSTSDYTNEARNDVKNYVPSYSYNAQVGQQDKWASDHWYATLLGKDEFPDVILGRISVNNPGDAENIVGKIIHYEENPTFGPWRARTGYIADDGPFDEEAEKVRLEYTPPEYEPRRVYLDDLPLEDNFYLNRKMVEKTRAKVSARATADIYKIFHDGVSYLTYFGHGSPNIWSDERIWFGGNSVNSDNLHLKNLDRLPIITNMTCNSGAIDYPVPKWNICITEDCMRQKDGGAIALFVPSGPGFSSSHQRMAQSLRKFLFKKHIRKLGDAIFLARCDYLLGGHPTEIMQMFILLGDPALHVQIPAEGIRMTVDREYIGPDDLPATIRASAKLNELKTGRIQYKLFSPNEDLIEETGELTFRGGEISYNFTIPRNAPFGIWRLRFYAWNEEEGRDAIGETTVKIGKPILNLEEAKLDRPVLRISSGEPVRIISVVENNSPLPCSDALCTLTRISPDNDFQDTKETRILGNEREMFQWDLLAQPGLNIYQVRLENYIQDPDPTINEKHTGMIYFPAWNDDATSKNLAINASLMEKKYVQAGKKIRMEIKLPVFNLGKSTLAKVDIVLQSGRSGNGTVLKSQRFRSLHSLASKRVSFNVLISDPSKTVDYTILASLDDGQSDATPEDNRFSLRYDPEDLCDLEINAGNITLSEKEPTEGKTIFFDVAVTNKGLAPADAFRMALYDDDPSSLGKKLFNHADHVDRNIPWLAPGETTTVRLRWDPVKNSGPQRVWIKADTYNRVAETDETNNVAQMDIYVRTKAILKPQPLDVEKTDDSDEALSRRLIARVKNEGETEARNVSIRFFKSRIQTPETRIGETLIDRIAPGETAESSYVWEITEEEARFTYTPSYQAFLKGSSQRLSSIVEEEKNTESEENQSSTKEKDG